MNTVDLTPKEFKKLPGYSTRLSVEELQGKVAGLIRKHGVKNYAWGSKDGDEFLVFDLDVEIQGVTKTLGFQFQPPQIRVKKRNTGGSSRWTYQDKPEASWRIFHDLLDRTLAAASLGIMPVHHVLMAFISKRLPDGTVGSFAEFMDTIIVEDQLDKLALPEPPGERKTVDAEYEEV